MQPPCIMDNMSSKILLVPLAVLALVLAWSSLNPKESGSGAPPYGEFEKDIPDLDPLSWLNNWQRPEGPPKVALQVGHWKNEELPEELEKLKGNTGASGGGKSEWEVNLEIAQQTAELLKQRGIEVEILPSTIPPSYWADVFLAIHADGSTDPSKSGFKIASPWRDFTNKSKDLVSILEETYKEATDMEVDPNITRNMRGYYAFSWWRYEHALHPMTTGAIVETGFLTSAKDRKIIVQSPETSAKALFDGVVEFLVKQDLLTS